MELIENVLQFLVTLLGFCLSVSYYRRRGRQAYFLLACFMAALRWAPFTGRFISFCFQKRPRCSMYQSLDGL